MEELTVRQDTSLQAKGQLNSSYFNDFINYLDASPKTVETYTKALKQFYVWTVDNGKLAPTREDVLAYRDYLASTGHKPTTVQNYITVVKIFFSWTAQRGLYPDVANHIKGARLDKNHKKDYLTSSQVKAVLGKIDTTTVKGQREYAMLALMVTGGLRTIEVERANIEDLRTIGDQTVLYIQGKGHVEKTDYVKVPAEVEQAIRIYLKSRPEAKGTEPLFTSSSNNSTGERLSTRTIRKIAKEHFIEAGYNSERITAHSLRHTAVTLALLNGATLQEAQQFARHANLNTTMIYSHNLEKAQNPCGSKIASAIFA